MLDKVQTLSRTLLSVLLLTAALAGQPLRVQASTAESGDNGNPQVFTSSKAHQRTTLEIVNMLGKHHYLEVKLDDSFSEKLLNSYLELLDPGKTYFLEKDLRSFMRHKHNLDDDIKKGQLGTLFHIYTVYHQRRIERADYTLDLLAHSAEKIDFKTEESIELDREESPWLSSKKEAEDLWRRLLKNDMLNLLLNEKPHEEIVTTLTKRYRNQLHMLRQTNSDDVFEYTMTAFTHQYDPHTDYFPPQESENFDIHMRLSLEGIGALLQREDEYVKVVKLITAGPADRGKQLQPADRIVGVGQGENGEVVDVEGWRLDDVVDLIRGKKGTIVQLKVIPADSADITKTKIIKITRDTVKLEEESAKKKIIEISRGSVKYKVGVIELPTFYIDFRAAMSGDPDYRSSARDVEQLIRELQKENISGLIIDLRNNGGGSLQEANDLTGLFIPTGPVVQIRGARDKVEPHIDPNPKVAYSGPLAVMVNRLSASASEIVAGAIQDYDRGIIVGNQTFGKGTVQTINPIDSGQLKYTQAKYYRINGDSTQERGVIPDISFPALMDLNEIGESALPEAMPWDQISPARYRKLANLRPLIDYLNTHHVERIATDPDFNYLQERIAFLQENRSQTHASLKETERRSERLAIEQRLLDMENKRRKAKSEELLKTYAELEKLEEESEDGEKPADSLLNEAGNILIDWFDLQQKQVALQ